MCGDLGLMACVMGLSDGCEVRGCVCGDGDGDGDGDDDVCVYVCAVHACVWVYVPTCLMKTVKVTQPWHVDRQYLR